jgi:hypothetical protein
MPMRSPIHLSPSLTGTIKCSYGVPPYMIHDPLSDGLWKRRQVPISQVFGPFRLDQRDEHLWRGPEVIHLDPKMLAVYRSPP